LSEPSDVQPPTTRSEPAAEAETASQPSEVEIQASRVAGALRRLIPDVTAQPARNYISVLVPTEQLEAAAIVLRDELGYALLSMVTAVDYPDHIEVIYPPSPSTIRTARSCARNCRASTCPIAHH